MRIRGIILIIAFALDLAVGDPGWLYHPVRAIGALISFLDRLLWKLSGGDESGKRARQKKTAAGAVLAVVVISVCAGVTFLIVRISEYFGVYVHAAVSALIGGVMLSCRSLRDESMKVYRSLKHGSLSDARRAVSMIVGRDTESLSEAGVIRAAVETVAENFADGVAAPLLWFFLAGPVGIVVYKAVNTMDSMIGYKNERYLYFGRFAARLDDVLGFVPARLGAVFMIAGAFLIPGFSGRGAADIFMRDRYNHKSPNSAQCEAAMAGALSVRLAGPASYFGEQVDKPYIGDDDREIEAEDIRRANVLMMFSGVLLAVFAALLSVVLGGSI